MYMLLALSMDDGKEENKTFQERHMGHQTLLPAREKTGGQRLCSCDRLRPWSRESVLCVWVAPCRYRVLRREGRQTHLTSWSRQHLAGGLAACLPPALTPPPRGQQITASETRTPSSSVPESDSRGIPRTHMW